MRAIDLSGKVALVMGVANQRSIAWATAEALGEAGCRLAFTYQGERLHQNVTKLGSNYDDALIMACDVTSEEQMDGVFSQIHKDYGRLDYLIHSIAFAPRKELEGDFIETSRDGWNMALEISAYSLVALSNRASKLMKKDGGSIIALTYLGSHRVFPKYNVMGSAKAALESCVRQLAFELGPSNVRVNAISAGPIATLSARGIAGFTSMLAHHRRKAPLQRNIKTSEVADAALFLCSPLSSGITGTIVWVDGGYHIMGL